MHYISPSLCSTPLRTVPLTLIGVGSSSSGTTTTSSFLWWPFIIETGFGETKFISWRLSRLNWKNYWQCKAYVKFQLLILAATLTTPVTLDKNFLVWSLIKHNYMIFSIFHPSIFDDCFYNWNKIFETLLFL